MPSNPSILTVDLGVLRYRDAWATQERAHAAILDGSGPEQILLVEHPPVITFGRRGDVGGRLLASSKLLESMGVEVVESDRGGDITFHGPGQVVVYPILKLSDHKLTVSGYVHRLEDAVLDALKQWSVAGEKDPAAPGVWARRPADGMLAKLCAIGVRIKRGVSLHGIALNVETDLSYFNLIVPCGLPGRPVTSLREILGAESAPTMQIVKRTLAESIRRMV